MAAGGAGSASGSVESSLDRRLQSVTSTTESIQGFSAWCIESKKYHSLIVRHWIKWLRKSDAAHRLNLFYLANDIIQNCKRKNAIVYRTAFAEVLPDAFLLVNSDGDFKVMKQVERILSIWEERNIYSGSLISELRGYLDKEESPPETPVEQKTPVDSKAALRSKIVSEFVPQALIDQLSNYKKSVEQVELREKQLAAMRVDVCSTEALKKLKDKAGGKKFSTDFEDGSAKLQEFVKFFDQQSKGGSLLLEALSNADIFYEMQYKEVKIVAHAYQTFANRVSHLKRKLDSLKANLPDLDESPIPSPSADAPSPTGSESPFRGLELSNPDPDLDGSAMDDEAEPPAPSPLSSPGRSPVQVFTVGENDNREVEDMELSEEETESGGIIVEQVEQPAPRNAAASVSERPQPPLTAEVSPAAQATPSAAAQATPSAVAQATPSAVALPAGLANVDLSKIGTLLNSLTSVIKNTGPAAESPPTPVAPISAVPTNPPASVAPKDSLANLLSQVDMTPEGLLGALSKAQRQSNSLEGLGSLLNNPVGKVSPDSSSKGKPPIPPSSALASAPQPKSDPLSSLPPVPSQPVSIVKRSPSPQSEASALVQALHRDMELTTEPESSVPSDSLESKIHNFLQGNPGFNAFNLGFTDPAAGGNNLSPLAGSDTRDGTPVRDEGGGTPTQDEIMDKPAVGPLPSKTPKSAVKMPTKATDGPPLDVHQNKTWHAPNHPHHSHLKTGEPQNGQGYQPYLRGAPETAGPGITTPVVHHQQIVEQTAGPLSRERLQGNASGSQTVEGFQGDGSGGWYGSSYPEPGPVHHRGHSEAAPGGDAGNQAPTLYPYQRDLNQEPRGMAPQQGVTSSSGFYNSSLPPVPKLPPPPEGFAAPSSVVTGEMVPPEQHSGHNQEMVGVTGARVDSVMSGMVVHDHQHKSMFHHEDPLYNHDDPYHHHEELPPPTEDLHYQEELCHYQEDPQYRDPPFHQDNSLRHQEDPYFPPTDPPSLPTGSPHRYPRVRGGLTPPVSAYGLYPHGSSPPHLGQRRAPPPHPEMMRHAGPPRHPGPRPPPIRPVHPLHHHLARGPRGPRPRPPFPPFHGPNPWLRGPRPGPRGGGPGGPGFPPKRPYLPPRY